MKSDKIKLCIIHPNLKCGGSERFISIVSNNINTDIFDVELYILDGSDPFYKIDNPQIRITFLAIKNVRKSLFSIVRIIRKSKPDILFTSSNHLNLFLSFFKKLFFPKLLFVARESSIVSINNKRLRFGSLYNFLIKKFYKNIDYIICQSIFMQNDLIENYNIQKNSTLVIYNPVEEFSFAEGRILNRKNDRHKFFTVGRLSSEKGIARILEALSALNIDFVFHIIGGGNEEYNLQQLTKKLNLQNKVVFEGVKNEPYKNMFDADLLLIGSYFEGFPNVVLEAGMLGIPVVGFKAPGGISEIIEDGVNGFLVAENNNQEKLFSDAILNAINYNFNKEKIKETTKKRFAMEKIINQLEMFFIDIYNKPIRN